MAPTSTKTQIKIMCCLRSTGKTHILYKLVEDRVSVNYYKGFQVLHCKQAVGCPYTTEMLCRGSGCDVTGSDITGSDSCSDNH